MAFRGSILAAMLTLVFLIPGSAARVKVVKSSDAQSRTVSRPVVEGTPNERASSTLRGLNKRRWNVVIYWARHGQSCANAIQDLGIHGRANKMAFTDPLLTNCGVTKSQEAGEKFAEWAWTGVSVNATGEVQVDDSKLHPAHMGADAHLGLDLVGSSTLMRAQETALFEFGRMAGRAESIHSQEAAPPIYAFPYISEHGATWDNTAETPDRQRKAWDTLTKSVPAGPALPQRMARDKKQMDWFNFGVDYTYIEDQPHKRQGVVYPAGEGASSHSVENFREFLAENVLATLALERHNKETDGTIRLGIASHSAFLLDVFESVCGLGAKPANNNVLAIPYNFEIAEFEDNGANQLTRISMEPDSLKEYCNPVLAPVSHSNRFPDFRLTPIIKGDELCKVEHARCEDQIKLMDLKYPYSPFTLRTGLPETNGPCQCSSYLSRSERLHGAFMP